VQCACARMASQTKFLWFCASDVVQWRCCVGDAPGACGVRSSEWSPAARGNATACSWLDARGAGRRGTAGFPCRTRPSGGGVCRLHSSFNLAPDLHLSTQAEHDAGCEELPIVRDEAKRWQRIARLHVLARETWVPILRMEFRMQAEQNTCVEQPTIVREEAQRRASHANPFETRLGLLLVRRELFRVQAERDAGVEELTIVRDEAKRWESRVNELLLKYGSVDLAEHNRVADALKVRRETPSKILFFR